MKPEQCVNENWTSITQNFVENIMFKSTEEALQGKKKKIKIKSEKSYTAYQTIGFVHFRWEL